MTTPLKKLMDAEGRKQSWLAAEAGVDAATMSRIVNGFIPDDDKRAAIATALGRTTDELWPESQAA